MAKETGLSSGPSKYAVTHHFRFDTLPRMDKEIGEKLDRIIELLEEITLHAADIYSVEKSVKAAAKSVESVGKKLVNAIGKDSAGVISPKKRTIKPKRP
jgi:hypothetical protein